MTKDEQLRNDVVERVKKAQEIVEKDDYRLHYHIMPPVGLLNDPNGWIQVNGIYHLFYQWMPFKTGHGAKFWGHYTTKNFVEWTHEPIALTPSESYEKDGCYSGSAIEYNGQLYLFYTGNVKNEKGERETYQCLAVSNDGLSFEKKGPVITLPKGYTAHFRDPKVWEQDGRFFMVIGAQTTDKKGAVVLFSSDNLIDWNEEGILAGGGSGKLANFGYMFECPDLFSLNGQDVFVFSPQGIEAEGMKYQNVYQAGYVLGIFDANNGTYDHGEFEELDRGFDFYAPQTTEDDKGRRILYAWMSVPDQDEQSHPTIEYGWLHNMTLPRELTLRDNKLLQLPLIELQQLRKGEAISHQVTIDKQRVEFEQVKGKSLELKVDEIAVETGMFDIIFGSAARVIYSSEQKIFTLERQSYVDGVTEKRQCALPKLESLHIFLDTSSIEIFINGGEETFTARFYPATNEDSVRFGATGKTSFNLRKWELKKLVVKQRE
ncbi:sucrose-6-phosphate hydrolase [Alkalihalobacillus sp. LMS39]|uniref:sucrose-6-phosphate hydrolase n=1 Tax=Alkalihalobacillus sp. LMS39 TaxID=2924032 RepID=UPI001FB4AAB1|nr:sucrose-6-phosphate hydrolase [Alkalihalobacillus sp. LMS39]UOE94858.1 sucrose-6-phosphate hydrolase [Alkalihalobacillus sp. LMS39]